MVCSLAIAFGMLFLMVCRSPTVNGLNSAKRGIGVKKQTFVCNDLKVLDTMAWWYDWGYNLDYYRDQSVCGKRIDKYEDLYTAMIWGFGPNQNYSSIEPTSEYVLGPNEPNHVKQSNLSPQEAADDWLKMENLTSVPSPRVLVSPSAAHCNGDNCNYGNTTVWFDEFFRLCQGCRVDFLATHTYWCGVDKTMNFLEGLYNRYNRKIWLTEFACVNKDNNASVVYQFMENILPRLESAHFVERYAWYMLRILDDSGWVKTSASLMDPDKSASSLTPLGELYRDFTV